MSNSRHGGCLIDRRHKGLPCWKCHADCVNILSTSSCCLTQNAEQFNGISLRNEVHTEMSKVKIVQSDKYVNEVCVTFPSGQTFMMPLYQTSPLSNV